MPGHLPEIRLARRDREREDASEPILRAVKVGRELTQAQVLDLEGNPIRLGTLWAEGPAVLVWLRHYG